MTRRGFVLWLMGPTSSGKTTIAEALVARLGAAYVPVVHFDGDQVRAWLGPGLGFAPADRLRVVGALADIADKVSTAGLNVVVSALTANPEARRHVAETVGGLIVAHIKCSPETCARRDPKGLYAKARRGEIDTLIGHDGGYVAPERPDIELDTEALTPEQAAAALEAHLTAGGRLPATAGA